MKTIATIFAMIVTMTFVGCGSTGEEKVETTDSTKTVTVDTTALPAATTTATPVDTVK
jgi:hypothetical protein